MSNAGVIDGPAFARERKSLSGRAGIESLPRLQDLGGRDADVGYTLFGGANERGHPSLRIMVAGRVVLECQRCLQPLDLPVTIDVVVELAQHQDEINSAEDEVDRVLAGKSMDVGALVEDEIILAMPMVPMHARCGSEQPAVLGVQRRSPFAMLAPFRKGRAGD